MKKRKGKVKVSLPQLRCTALKDKLQREEEENMRSALRNSAIEAGTCISMSRGYRALVETTESEKGDFIDMPRPRQLEKSHQCVKERNQP